jgi:hypothetical protein
MSNAHEAQFSGAGSMFPFLSVMFCTIGVLALLLVAGSLEAAGEAGNIEARLARARTADGDLARDERTAGKALSEITSRREIARTASSELTRLAELREKNAALHAQSNELLAGVNEAQAKVNEANAIPDKVVLVRQLASIEAMLASVNQLVRMLTAEVEKLQAEALSLDQRLQKVRDTAAAGRVSVSVEGDLARRRPALIELNRGGVVVHTAGLGLVARKLVTGAALDGDAGLLSKFARRIARPDDRRYAIVLVRPGSAAIYNRLSKLLVSHRARFIAEPVDAGVPITFKE